MNIYTILHKSNGRALYETEAGSAAEALKKMEADIGPIELHILDKTKRTEIPEWRNFLSFTEALDEFPPEELADFEIS